MLRVGNTENKIITIKKLFNRFFAGKTLQHKRYDESNSSQPITCLTYQLTTPNDTEKYTT